MEEIIVGIVEGTMIQSWDAIMEATLHKKEPWDFSRQSRGTPWPKGLINAAKNDLDEFVHILEAERITVSRPTPYDFSKPYTTGDSEMKRGCYVDLTLGT